jgi:hypothetical protein
MLVRRMATVTICAPEASTAARVSAKSLYFPVPMSSRELQLWPAMTSALLISHRQPRRRFPADRHQQSGYAGARSSARSRRFFHGDLFPRKRHALEQRSKRERRFVALRSTVHNHLNHVPNPRAMRDMLFP